MKKNELIITFKTSIRCLKYICDLFSFKEEKCSLKDHCGLNHAACSTQSSKGALLG